MRFGNSTYNLDLDEFESAREILRRAREPILKTRLQKIGYWLLNVAVYGFMTTLGLHLILLVLPEFFELGDWVFSLHAVLTVLDVLFGVSAPIIFVFNIPLLRRIRSQIRFTRQFGLWEVFNVPWRDLSLKNKILKVITFAPGAVGTAIVVLGLFLGFEENGIEGAFWGALLSSLVGGVLLSTYFIKQGRQRLLEIEESLVGLREQAADAQAAHITIPKVEYAILSELERTQISDDREKYIAASEDTEKHFEFIVQKSSAVHRVLSQLNSETRTLVERKIDSLMLDPRPADAVPGAKGELLNVGVEGTDVLIHYAVDEEGRRVLVHRLALGDESSDRTNEGGDF